MVYSALLKELTRSFVFTLPVSRNYVLTDFTDTADKAALLEIPDSIQAFETKNIK